MLELHHSTHSTCSQKVRICLAEKGLAWHSRHVNLRAFEQLEPAFLALNPDAVVPVLVHDGCVIRESLVINEYLEDVFAAPALRPADALARARMREWTLYVAEEPTWAVKTPSFDKNIRPEIAGKYGDAQLAAIAARMPNRDTAARWVKAVKEGFGEAELQASLARLAKTLDRMQGALAEGPWLAGDTYSLADVDMAPFVHRIAHLGETAMIERRPRVAQWYARMRARPAFQQAMSWRP
ncbi:MAG TPA: glutathione S-transferase family protein [Burkholderiales bacterium]|nr:glutathione S-transferase family protein [Burkholderiales bacterium]